MNAIDAHKSLLAHDEATAWHCARVGIASAAILPGHYKGEELDRTSAFLGGYLHDIGKLLVDAAIIRKAGPLTETEKEQMRMHPRYGVELIKSELPQFATPIVLYLVGGHHEGNGYLRASPLQVENNRRGFHCPELLEKLSAIDALDAATDPRRKYHHALTLDEAVRHLSGSYQESLLMQIRDELEKAQRIIS